MKEEKPKRKQQAGLNRQQRTAIAVIVAIVYGLIARMLFVGIEFYPAVSLVFLTLTPFAIGTLSVSLYPDKSLSMSKAFSVSASTSVLFLISTALATVDAYFWICVVMAAPFVFVLAGLGGIVMRWILRRGSKQKRKRMYSFIGLTLLAPYILAPIESQITPADMYRTVHEQIIIDASPELIWQNIIRVDTITDQRLNLFHLIGIPRPIRATLDYEGIGGVRLGEFENGLSFAEEIIVWEPNRTVSFTIRVNHNELESPSLQQIGGRYFEVLKATYTIEPLDDGRVILHLSSDYRLSTTFNGYAALWANWVLHDFQGFVLNTVKIRTEAP